MRNPILTRSSVSPMALLFSLLVAAAMPAAATPVTYSDLLIYTMPGDIERSILLDEGVNNFTGPLLFARVTNTNVARDTVLNFRQSLPSVDADPSGFSDSIIMKVVGPNLEFYFWSDGQSPPNLSYAQNLAALNLNNPLFVPAQDEANWGNVADVSGVLFQGVVPPLNNIAFASDFNGSGVGAGGGEGGQGGGSPPFKASDTFALRTNMIICSASFTDAPGFSQSNTNVCNSGNPFRPQPFANGMPIFSQNYKIISSAFGILEPPPHPGDPPEGQPSDIVAMQVLGGDCLVPPCNVLVNWGVWSEDQTTSMAQFLAAMGNPLLTTLNGDENRHDRLNFLPPDAVAPFAFIQFDSDPVPEPPSLPLTGAGILLAWLARWHRKSAAAGLGKQTYRGGTTNYWAGFRKRYASHLLRSLPRG